eukprot:jgi/Mesvir1/14269/Mv09700-RA.1
MGYSKAASMPGKFHGDLSSIPVFPSGVRNMPSTCVLRTEGGMAVAESAYRTWKREHPSALEDFDQIFSRTIGRQLAVFLDYDGTLSPIVENPDMAFMSDEMRSAVRQVASQFPTAIVSGRGREKVANFVQLEELFYAGSHGMDIAGPLPETVSLWNQMPSMGPAVRFQPALEYAAIADSACSHLRSRLRHIPGAYVEHNVYCLSVHLRQVDPRYWEEMRQAVADVIAASDGVLRGMTGRKVLEVRPNISWNKGMALEFLLESSGLSSRDDVTCIYLGDDRTDEDAFRVLADKGYGFGVLVSSVPKDTCAKYSLRDPAEVCRFLKRLGGTKELPPAVPACLPSWTAGFLEEGEEGPQDGSANHVKDDTACVKNGKLLPAANLGAMGARKSHLGRGRLKGIQSSISCPCQMVCLAN